MTMRVHIARRCHNAAPRGEPIATSSDTSWQQPAIEQSGFRRFVRTLRERYLLIGLVTLAAVGLAAAYVVTADDVYEARADILVSPIPAGDSTLPTLGLITETT